MLIHSFLKRISNLRFVLASLHTRLIAFEGIFTSLLIQFFFAPDNLPTNIHYYGAFLKSKKEAVVTVN